MKPKGLGLNRIGDNSLKQGFYFIFTYDIRERHRKAKPSVGVGRKATEYMLWVSRVPKEIRSLGWRPLSFVVRQHLHLYKGGNYEASG
jgi:hypothetical protein